ncbi:MAG: hypothetical protein FWG98_12650 [Candidatus Cloacimonetes bacterium]|nr:hypothetical protein [Candidatus Cloacimonadota bacterium]
MWGGSDTEIAAGGVSWEGPRNDGLGVVARRLLRGEFHGRDLATTGRGDRKKGPRKDREGIVARRLLRGEFHGRDLARTDWWDSGTEIAS